MTHQPNNVSAAGVLSDAVTVPRAPIEWLKTHYPALCEKAGLCERIGGRLYIRTVAAASAQATGQAESFVLRALVAAGHVSQDKVDEAFRIAESTPGVSARSPAAREAGDGVTLTDERILHLVEPFADDYMMMDHKEEIVAYVRALLREAGSR